MLSSASLMDAFAAQAARFPRRPALCADGGRTWSYRELDACATALAAELARLDVTAECRVAVAGGRTAETVAAILGVLRTGAAYCVIDPVMPPARRQMILDDLAPAAIVMAEPDLAVPSGATCPVVRPPVAASSPNGRPGGLPPSDPSALAYVMYTSGSTGWPKGVMVEHASVLNMLRSYESLAPAWDGFTGTLLAPVVFDVSVWEIFSVLCYGGTLHVPARHRLTDGDELWRFLADAGIGSAYLPPGLLASVAEAAQRRSGALRRVLVGVEPIAQGLLNRFRVACPGLRVVNGYGPTETTITATLHLMGKVTDPSRRVPIGRAVLGSQVEVVDAGLLPVPPGEIGEILVSGSCLARGYLGQDAGGFADLPAGRAYRTGDYGRFLPDGALEFCGRRDGQVKINGIRVETGEVEAALSAMPGIRRCAVLVAREPGTTRLVAAVEAPPWLAASSVREHLAARLPAHAMPSRIVVMRAFPLTDNGKIDTRALLAAGGERPANAPPFVVPWSPWQKEIADAWSQVLGIAKIGLDDDFHQFGGTSLDAVRIAALLRGGGRAVSAGTILEARTVRGLAARQPARREGPRLEPAGPGAYPATRAHEGLWAWRELNPDAAATTVVHAIRLEGATDPVRMHRAMCAVINRHEALRTTFEMTADQRLQQRVAAQYQCELPVIRVGSPEEVDRCVGELLRHRFDVRSRPWLARLLFGPGFGALVIAADHLVFDGESAAILQHDLALAYDSPEARATAVAGPASAAPLAAPPPGRAARVRRFWRDALEGFCDRPALAEPLITPMGGRRPRLLEGVIDPAVWEAVGALARAARTTPFVVVLAALKAFFRERSGETENTVSVAVSRRDAVGCPDAIGHFVNLVPFRDRIARSAAASMPFARYLTDVAGQVRQGMAHSDLPFEDMIAHVPRPLTADVAGPARVVLVQQVPVGTSVTEGGLCLKPWPRRPFNAIYDLTVFLDEGTGAEPAVLGWLWDGARALENSVESMAEAFTEFMRAAVTEPARPLAALPSVAPGEARLMAATAAPEGQPALDGLDNLVSLFAEQVSLRPEAIAVQDGQRMVSYAELDRRASAIAEALAVDGGLSCAVIVLEKSAGLLAAMLAVLRAGAAYLPLAPEHARTRLPDVAARAGARACVTDSGIAAALTLPENTRLILADQVPARAAWGDRPASPARPEDLAYIMPTSGSTGPPKLVGVPHRAVVRLVHRSRTLPLDHTDRTMLIANPSFDAATFEVWGALANGGRVVVPDVSELRDPALLCSAIMMYGITAGFFTTTLFERLVEAAPGRLAGMRHVIVGGEAVPPRLFAEAGASLPDGVLVNGYGPTENTTFSCCFRPDREPGLLRSLPIGRPLSGSGALVADESLRPLPPGVPGEILVTGLGLAVGYIDDPELTARRFVCLDALEGARAYRTGDLGRLLPDGTLEYLGRIDRQVKIRGFRVEPGEVEAALSGHPAVRRAVVYAEDIGGIRTLLAAVEADAVDSATLRSWLADRLPDYLLPARIRVVDRLPMTANGKADHAALRDAEPADGHAEHEEARTEVQQAVTQICGQLLPTTAIGLDDDLFELGANSMTVLALAARLSQHLGRTVPTHLVYTTPTVRSLSARIESGGVAADDEKTRRVRERAARIRAGHLRSRP